MISDLSGTPPWVDDSVVRIAQPPDSPGDDITPFNIYLNMSSLTTLFVVGPEEYVEFNESLGSKAFLEHVWDESTTPLKEGGESR